MNQQQWNPKTVEPADRETCSIFLDRGLASPVIVVGLPYFKELKGFCDPFGAKEAGQTLPLDRVTAWVHAGAIVDPPDEFFD